MVTREVVSILLVEDNPGDADLIEAYLEPQPYLDATLNRVERLSEAVEAMERGEAPDLVLLDLTLPDSNGLDTMKRLRKTSLQAPIIVLTGLSDEQLAWDAIRAGADDFLPKNELTPELLARSIRYALDRAAAARAVRRRDEQLVNAKKLEAVGRLAGGIAHDFNNLLTAVNGYADLLEEPDVGRAEIQDAATQIKEAAARGGRLTRQLLAFSQQQVLDKSVLLVPEVAESLQPMLSQLIGEHIRLKIETSGAEVPVFVDRSQLEQVLMNLILNARDALSDGGAITISVDAVEFDDDGDVPAMLPEPPGPGRYARLTVRDDGTGMNPETLEHVFEPFFTTKGQEKGGGLGLATVYGVVQEVDGHVSVASELGSGSEFTILLPETHRSRSPAEAETTPPAESPAVVGAKGTVLVVEDEDPVRAVAVRSLTRAGFRVLEARDGREALDVLRAADTRVDVLLTDVVMPNMGGVELAARSREIAPDLAVVLTSGYTQDELVQDGIDHRTVIFLPKPYSPTELKDKVAEALRR